MNATLSTALWAAGSMAALGVLFALGLVVVARLFGVERNPLVEKVLAALPGINCGSCAYRGCEAYAEAVAAGADVALCTPGGPDVAQALAALMGVEVGEVRRMRAVVRCQGGRSNCPERFRYFGEPDCRAAHIISGGPKACPDGCLGFGTCVAACPFGAISMDAERLPVIEPDACTGCGACIKVCPRRLIGLIPADCHIYLGCSVRGRGKAVKDICSVGCIACGLCAKKDPNGAIEMKDNLPVLDFEKADGDFSVAAEVCPMACFVVEQPGPAGEDVGAETVAAGEA